jgi:hypothetical protein
MEIGEKRSGLQSVCFSRFVSCSWVSLDCDLPIAVVERGEVGDEDGKKGQVG